MRICDRGTLIVSNAIDSLDSKDVDAQLQGDLRGEGGGDGRVGDVPGAAANTTTHWA